MEIHHYIFLYHFSSSAYHLFPVLSSQETGWRQSSNIHRRTCSWRWVKEHFHPQPLDFLPDKSHCKQTCHPLRLSLSFFGWRRKSFLSITWCRSWNTCSFFMIKPSLFVPWIPMSKNGKRFFMHRQWCSFHATLRFVSCSSFLSVLCFSHISIFVSLSLFVLSSNIISCQTFVLFCLSLSLSVSFDCHERRVMFYHLQWKVLWYRTLFTLNKFLPE